MKIFFRKTLALVLALSLILSLGLSAAASDAMGEDLTAMDTLLHQETQLSTNTFWSTAYNDMRTENLITYTPNMNVMPIVTYGQVLTDRNTVTDTARALESQGWRVVAGINGDFYNVNTGLPIGLVISEGVLRSSDGGYYAIPPAHRGEQSTGLRRGDLPLYIRFQHQAHHRQHRGRR